MGTKIEPRPGFLRRAEPAFRVENATEYGKCRANGRGQQAPGSEATGSKEARMSQQTATRHKRGGLYFEDFVVGETVEHRYTRTVTQMDNMLFSNMTLNPQPLHIDRHFCEQETEWGQPLMNSLFTLGLMIGIQVSDMTVGTTIANLGMTDVKFPHPLFEGDTVHCTTEVIGKRESKSRPGAGIVEFHHRAYNQDNKLVAECRRQAFIRMWPK
jgi:acyl dehydratase